MSNGRDRAQAGPSLFVNHTPLPGACLFGLPGPRVCAVGQHIEQSDSAIVIIPVDQKGTTGERALRKVNSAVMMNQHNPHGPPRKWHICFRRILAWALLPTGSLPSVIKLVLTIPGKGVSASVQVEWQSLSNRQKEKKT